MPYFQLVVLILHHLSFALNKKAKILVRVLFLLRSVQPARISFLHSKSGQKIVCDTSLEGGKRWHYFTKIFQICSDSGTSHVFHPSLCLSCCACKIENKPKGKQMLPPAQPPLFGPRKGGVCVCTWGRGALMALWRAVQGCSMRIQRKSASSASRATVFFSIWLANTLSRKSVVLIATGLLQLLRKQEVLRYWVTPCFLMAANAHMHCFRLTILEILRKSAGNIFFI